MHTVVIDRTIHYGDVKLMVASDPDDRCFIGLNLSRGQRGNVVFIEVAPQTIDALEAGEVDLYTVIRERGIGLVVELPREVVTRPARPAPPDSRLHA